MAQYDIKFGGPLGSWRVFGELSLEGVTLDEAATQRVSARAIEIANELVAAGMTVDPVHVGPLSEAIAARIAQAFPGSTCRVTQLVPNR